VATFRAACVTGVLDPHGACRQSGQDPILQASPLLSEYHPATEQLPLIARFCRRIRTVGSALLRCNRFVPRASRRSVSFTVASNIAGALENLDFVTRIEGRDDASTHCARRLRRSVELALSGGGAYTSSAASISPKGMRMIFDADCHLSPNPGALDVTADGLVSLLDVNCVDRSLCWLKPAYARDVEEGNRTVYQAARRYPDRIIGFGWANPRLGLAAAFDAVKRCLEEYGFPGVKLNGAQDDYFVDDEKLSIPIAERISRAGAMLAFHVGADAYERTHPFRIAKIAARFPETKILLAHMGGVGVPSLHAACIEFARRHRNLYLIGSASESRAILNAIREVGPHRVFFGSDTPFGLMHVELARYRALLADLDETSRTLVMGGAVARLLGL
jgi:predicted TIM-barrel fold metal-dependent hydrolase